jgi:hypothetical protein
LVLCDQGVTEEAESGDEEGEAEAELETVFRGFGTIHEWWSLRCGYS